MFFKFVKCNVRILQNEKEFIHTRTIFKAGSADASPL